MTNTISISAFGKIDRAPSGMGIDFLRWAGSRLSTDSSRDFANLTKENFLNAALLKLKQEMGEDLFNRLSYEDKIFVIETAGSVDLGKRVSLRKIFENIENYEP
jgi:hypothetical protein